MENDTEIIPYILVVLNHIFQTIVCCRMITIQKIIFENPNNLFYNTAFSVDEQTEV
jgi:hypothetical protein